MHQYVTPETTRKTLLYICYIFLNLSKAFDTVNHYILQKLSNYELETTHYFGLLVTLKTDSCTCPKMKLTLLYALFCELYLKKRPLFLITSPLSPISYLKFYLLMTQGKASLFIKHISAARQLKVLYIKCKNAKEPHNKMIFKHTILK